MARELHDLLDAAGIARPVVLAGHSVGGLVAQVFPRLYPGEVAGVALIDSSYPSQDARLPKAWLQDYPGGKLAEVALEYASPLGLRRLRRTLTGQKTDDAGDALKLSSRSRRAFAKELLTFDAVLHQAATTAEDLGDLPLAVITSSERAPGQPYGSRAQRSRSPSS